MAAKALLLASLGSAHAWGPGGWYGHGGSGSDGDDHGGHGYGDAGGLGSSGAFAGADFDVARATHYRNVHGILAAVAFVIVFPLGAVLMRLVPGRPALWIHGLAQSAGYVLSIAGAALGFWLVHEIKTPPNNGSLLDSSHTNYHPIIGIVLFVALLPQPVLGLIHHLRFRRVQRRQVWSHLHLWNGRVMVPLGIINGGLGLRLAGASSRLKTAYAIVAGIMGGLWLLVTVFAELRRLHRDRGPEEDARGGYPMLRRRRSRGRQDRTEKVLHRAGSGHSTRGAASSLRS